eukprot:g3171.t1
MSKAERKNVKVVTIGDGAVGKTCMLISYTKGSFPEDYVPTIFDNYTAEVDTTSHGTVRLNLWDTAGQEDYDNIRGLAYKEVDAFLIAFSVISPSSFSNVKEKWFPSITNSESSSAKVVLVGTKIDLRDDEETVEALDKRNRKPVTKEEGIRLAKEIGAVAYVECAAITGEGLKEVFSAALKAGLTKKKKKDRCVLL